MSSLPPGYFTVSSLIELIEEYARDARKNSVRKEDIKKAFIKANKKKFNNAESEFCHLYWRAKRSSYFIEGTRGNELVVALTDKAKLKKIEAQFAQAAKLKSNKYILVSFDIPQSKTVVRNYLRSFLKRNGFQLIQRSVLIGNVDVATELMSLLKEHGVDEWVRIFYVDKIVI